MTVECAAGSTNVASILKDYAFDEHSKAAKENDTGYNIILLGFDVEEEEYNNIMESQELGLGLDTPENEEDMKHFFARERSQEDKTALMKVYKITAPEVDMQGMEKAILNRVATKFYI